jgi:excisionase family DNA binding protein
VSSNQLTAEQLCSAGVVNPKEAAKLLGIGHTMLYALMKKGELPYVLIGRSRRIPRAGIIRYLAEHLTSGPA